MSDIITPEEEVAMLAAEQDSTLTERERAMRRKFREEKPLIFRKIVKQADMIKRRESVAFVQLEWDYACNFQCEHCCIEDLKKPKGTRRMTHDDLRRIADQADEMNLVSWCISGGEPSAFKDLPDIVRAIGPERFIISMDTHGWYLDEEKIKWLVSIGINRIHLSIDGNEEAHDTFRKQKGSWQKCIDLLPICKKYGLDVIVNIVVVKSDLRTGALVQFLEFLKQFNVYAGLIYARPMGNFRESEWAQQEIMDTEDHKELDRLSKIYFAGTRHSIVNGYFFKCFTFKKQISITAYGDVMGCPGMPITHGNLLDESLRTIVERALENPWFSYDYLNECLIGNTDSFFYQNIMPQVHEIAKADGVAAWIAGGSKGLPRPVYPVDYRRLNWYLDEAVKQPTRADWEREQREKGLLV